MSGSWPPKPQGGGTVRECTVPSSKAEHGVEDELLDQMFFRRRLAAIETRRLELVSSRQDPTAEEARELLELLRERVEIEQAARFLGIFKHDMSPPTPPPNIDTIRPITGQVEDEPNSVWIEGDEEDDEEDEDTVLEPRLIETWDKPLSQLPTVLIRNPVPSLRRSTQRDDVAKILGSEEDE